MPKNTAGRRLVGLNAGAEYADVSTRTLRRWIACGTLPGYRVGPRLVKVDLDDLDRITRPIPTVAPKPPAQPIGGGLK